MGQVIRCAQHLFGEAQFRTRRWRIRNAKGAQDTAQHILVAGLVQRNPDVMAANLPEVQPFQPPGGEDPGLAHPNLHRNGVEKRLWRQGRTGIAQGFGQTDGQAVNPFRNRAQADGAVENGVETGHDRQQSLRRADIRGGLFAPDMLLAGLQRQTISLVAPDIDGDAHDPPRHIALVLVLAGEERRMRAAIAHRHAEPLRGADGDVSPHGAGLLQHRQRQKIGCHHRHSLGRVQGGDLAGQVTHMAPSAGILEDRAKDSLGLQILGRADDHLNPQRHSPGLDHANGLRMAVFIHEKRARL